MSDKEEKIIEEEIVSESGGEEIETKVAEPIEVKEDEKIAPVEAVQPKEVSSKEFRGSRDNRDRRKNERRPSRRPERARQEFDNKIISVRRVTRVVSGGRRFSFSISTVIGDKKGRVGVGVGKASDTPIAIEKAMRAAKKNMINVSLTSKNSIAHPVEAKYSSARISILPAPGKGVIAGSAARVVLELAGIKEVSSKILSKSKNKLNIARATIKALEGLKKEKVKIKA
jgi:small subunit ribosomal protein S5